MSNTAPSRAMESAYMRFAKLETAATFYDRELDVKIKRFTGLFEPAVIIFMGVVVGFVAVALVSAMYGIYHQVKVQ